MPKFSLPIAPFPWDREGGETGSGSWPRSWCVQWVIEKKKKKKKTLFPPQGDVFVTIDKLTSTGIKVVSETLKKPGHGNKAVHYFVLSSLFGRKDSFTVCN